MKTVLKLIENHGGLESLKSTPIRIENKPYMRLVIEHIGEGPNGRPMISVAHYFEQNGDLMADPDMAFEVARVPKIRKRGGVPRAVEEDTMFPVYFQQDSLGVFRRAMWKDEKRGVLVDVREKRDQESFARMWDRNLKAQGFLKAADKAKEAS